MKLTDLATAGGCAAKYSAARLEELLRGFVPAEAENLLVGLDPSDDAAVYGSTTSARSSSRSTSFRRSSTTRAISARSPRRMRSTTSSRWAVAAARALGRRAARGSAGRDGARRFRRADARCARPVRCSPEATRFATPSRSTGSPSSAPSARPASGRRRRAARGCALSDEAARDGARARRCRAEGWRTLDESDRLDADAERAAADLVRLVGPNAVTDGPGFGLAGQTGSLVTSVTRSARPGGSDRGRPVQRPHPTDRFVERRQASTGPAERERGPERLRQIVLSPGHAPAFVQTPGGLTVPTTASPYFGSASRIV